MEAELITIGDEILIGQIVDTNSAFLGTRLGESGIRVARITSISDRAEEITRAIEEALSRSPLVITTGGLGPTKDDITKITLSELFAMPLVRDASTYAFLEQMLAQRGLEFNALNQAQALVPKGCTVLPNKNGTAPGLWFERQEGVLICLPGVPFEMKALITDEVLPRLQHHFALQRDTHVTALTFGFPESALAERIAPWEEALPPQLHLAYLPSPLGIRLRLSAYGLPAEEAQTQINTQFSLLEQEIGPYIVGYGETSLEQAVGERLRALGATLSVAESCTGGNIAHRLTLQEGASSYLLGGVVAYSNAVKETLLGVSAALLSEHGAVSEPVAQAMARGVRQALGSTYGIGVTGIAGPGGGSPEKPVGLIWVAVSGPEGTVARKLTLGEIRAVNIQRASSDALNLLRLHLPSTPEG